MDIHSRTELFGLLLLMILMPVWLLGCFIVTQRHTLMLAQQLEQQFSLDQQLGEQVTYLPGRQVSMGITAGLVFALAFNVPPSYYGAALSGNLPVLSIFLGQVMLWCTAGFLLAVRLHIAGTYYRLGKTIELSIFEPSRLAPFARVGMLDVVIVVGCMVVATVQSIDARFRVENYLSALLVAVPAGVALLLGPMWTLHQRLAARKRQLLGEVRKQMQSAPETTGADDMSQLEALLQRRDRISALVTWPLDMAIWSRLLFYGLLPPLAWAGAALVEVAIARLLGA